MKPHGMRLGVASSLSPYQTLDTIPPTEPRSASLAQAEREVKALQEENSKLREELYDIRSLYKQLISESSQEQYDERRVYLLKSQVIQLERQILLLSDGLSSRTATLLEVENALAAIADQCRSHMGPNNLGAVSVPRTDIELIVQTAESARIKLYKNVESNTVEKLSKPLLMMGKYAVEHQSEPLTLMDVCSGRLDHINLKHVAKLESRLARLYKQLVSVNQSLCTVVSSDPEGSKPVNRQPQLQKPFLGEISLERVLSGLPNFHKSRQQEGRQMIEALLKAMNYKLHMAATEHKGAEVEVKFHQAVYQLQLDYIDSLFRALRESYGTFEENANELLCKPLQEVFKKYENLRDTASEEALRDFLAVFKQHANQIENTVQQMTSRQMNNQSGQEALSEFGDQFFQSLEKLQMEHQHKRDQQVAQIDTLKEELERHLEELLVMFPPRPDPEEESIVEATANISLNDEVADEKEQKKKSINSTPNARERRSLKRAGNGKPDCSCGVESPDSPDSTNVGNSGELVVNNKTNIAGAGGQTPKTPGYGKKTGIKPPTGRTPLTPAPQGRNLRTPGSKKPVPGVGMAKLTLKPRSKKPEGDGSPQDEEGGKVTSGMSRSSSLTKLDRGAVSPDAENKSQIQRSGSVTKRNISKIPSPSPGKK